MLPQFVTTSLSAGSGAALTDAGVQLYGCVSGTGPCRLNELSIISAFAAGAVSPALGFGGSFVQSTGTVTLATAQAYAATLDRGQFNIAAADDVLRGAAQLIRMALRQF